MKEILLGRRRLPALLFDHELIRVHQTNVRNEQRRQVDRSGEHRVEVDVDDGISFTVEDWIEFRKDRSDAWYVYDPAFVRFEHGDEILLGHEFDLKAITRFLLVGPEDFEWPAIVCGNQQVVSISMCEVTLETHKVLLNHAAHGVIRCIAPAVERDMNQGFDGHCDSPR